MVAGAPHLRQPKKLTKSTGSRPPVPGTVREAPGATTSTKFFLVKLLSPGHYFLFLYTVVFMFFLMSYRLISDFSSCIKLKRVVVFYQALHITSFHFLT